MNVKNKIKFDKKTNLIYIWQGEVSYDINIKLQTLKNLKYMYEQISSTLIKGFKSFNINTNFKTFKKINQSMWENIEKGAIFIWIGLRHFHKIPWNLLKQKNIYTIYYQTDPINKRSNFFEQYNKLIVNTHIDEIWDYSLKNINYLKNIVNISRLRYIPPGFLYRKRIIQKSSKDMKLIFLGNPKYRIKSWNEYLKLPLISGKLESVNNIWSEKAFENFIDRPYSYIFLNLHKKKNKKCLEAVRLSKLLSSGAIIISEHCDLEDEEKFKNLIFFCHKNEIENKFCELINMDQEKRQILSDQIYIRFKKKFLPKKLLKASHFIEKGDIFL